MPVYVCAFNCYALINFSSHTNEFLRECQGAAILDNEFNRGRSKLNEREKRQAALPILVFGYDMVKIYGFVIMLYYIIQYKYKCIHYNFLQYLLNI